MTEQDLAIDLRARLNPKTGRIEISVLSETEPKDVDALLGALIRFRGAVDGGALENLSVSTPKTDTGSMPGWEKATCDIIK